MKISPSIHSKGRSCYEPRNKAKKILFYPVESSCCAGSEVTLKTMQAVKNCEFQTSLKVLVSVGATLKFKKYFRVLVGIKVKVYKLLPL